MSGPVIVGEPPPRGARSAAARKRALSYRRLLDQGEWVGDKEPHDKRPQAAKRAQNAIDLCYRHGGYQPGTLERAVWEIQSGPHASKWRWGIRVKRAEPG